MSLTESTILNFKISKRYKDIFDLYIHRGEPTPFSLGTLVVFAFCFLILIVATFNQFNFSHPWFIYIKDVGLDYHLKTVAYTPQIPVMLFIIYILGKNYSVALFGLYLIVGFFIWPVFAFGGGLGYAQNYLFGYFLGFIFAILITGSMLNKSLDIKTRILSALAGVGAIHLTGLLYCILLAIFQIIDFGLIAPIVRILTGEKILYDIIFSILIFLIAPYIKNVFWVCMKPKADNPKISKKYRHKK